MHDHIMTMLAALSTRLLRRVDISVEPFLALTRAYLMMDLRNQHFGHATATGATDVLPPLFWVVGQYLLVSGLVSALLFARVDAFFFALVTLSMSMVVMATAVIVEFNEVVLDPSDLEVIGHLPMPLRTYAAARLANLQVYVLLVTAALNVFPAIVGMGLRDAGWLFFPAYAMAALLGNLGITAMVIMLYTTLLSSPLGNAIKQVLAWTQILLIMLVVYGGQAVLRHANDTLAMLAYNLPQWVRLLPPAWLAALVDGWATGHPGTSLWLFVTCVLIVAGLWLAVMRQLTIAYARMQPSTTVWQRAILPPLPRPGALAGRLARYLTHPGEERTAFWLCTTMLKRDHALRMRSWPALGVVVAFPLLGLATAQLRDPFVHPGVVSAMSIACLYVLMTPIPGIMHNLTFSQDHAAAWLLWSSPVVDCVAFAEGMRKAITYRLMLPLLLGLCVVWAIAWQDIGHAFVYGVLGALLLVGTGHATQMGIVRTFPFSTPLVRGQTMGSIALFTALVNAVALVGAIVHAYSTYTTLAFTGYGVGLGLLVLLLRQMARRVLQRRFAREVTYA